MNPDFLLENYCYELPEEQIAQHPSAERDGSRLLVLDRKKDIKTFTSFGKLGDFLPKGALLVVNNSKVIPARLIGQKPTSGRVEFLLLTPTSLIKPEKHGNGFCAEVEGLLKASKGPRQGESISFGPKLGLKVLKKGEFGKSRVRLMWSGDLAEIILSLGKMPLPPYIRRKAVSKDKTRYQTIYARNDKLGSVAAPTAGLHFTQNLREKLANQGMGWAEVTLYVGYGTFSPVRKPDIRDHQMHFEYIEVPRETANAVRRAKEEGRPIVTVGTTSARTLEGMFANCGKVQEFSGKTDIFIYPGYEFKVVDKLLTNFHLPQSSLVIMVSALAGRNRILGCYASALAKGFRFFSYGDAMLIS